MSALELFLAFPPLQRALLAALVVAVVAGFLGVFVVLRGYAMLGDGLAHVSFSGVAIGLVVGVYPLALALALAVAGAMLVQWLRAANVVKGDTAIGILFTAGLALGVLIVSATRGFGVDVMSYLFGNLLLVSSLDVALILGLGVALVALFALLRKELFYVTFSEEAARVSGLPVGVLNALFAALTAATIVVSARIVGVLLVSALLVVPAASGLQLARSFRGALAWSVAFGVASVLLGVVSAAQWGLATGASIALAATVLFGGAAAARFATTRARRATV